MKPKQAPAKKELSPTDLRRALRSALTEALAQCERLPSPAERIATIGRGMELLASLDEQEAATDAVTIAKVRALPEWSKLISWFWQLLPADLHQAFHDGLEALQRGEVPELPTAPPAPESDPPAALPAPVDTAPSAPVEMAPVESEPPVPDLLPAGWSPETEAAAPPASPSELRCAFCDAVVTGAQEYCESCGGVNRHYERPAPDVPYGVQRILNAGRDRFEQEWGAATPIPTPEQQRQRALNRVVANVAVGVGQTLNRAGQLRRDRLEREREAEQKRIQAERPTRTPEGRLIPNLDPPGHVPAVEDLTPRDRFLDKRDEEDLVNEWRERNGRTSLS